MKNTISLPKAFGRILVEYSLIFPLVYLLSGLLDAPMSWILLLLVPACAILGAVLRRFLPAGGLEIGLCLLLSLALAGVTAGAYALRANPANYVLPVIIAPFAGVRGRQLIQHDWHGVMPNFVPCLMLILDLILIAMINYIGRLTPFLPVISVAGPVALVAGYYLMNALSRRNLADDQRLEQAGGTTRRTAVPRNLAPQNRALVTGLLLLGGVLSFLPFLVTAAKYLVKILVKILGFLFGLLVSLAPQAPTKGEGTEEVLPENFMQYQQNDMWDMFFRILMGVVFAAVLITLVILVFIAIRKGWKLLKELLQKLANDRGFIGADSLDFDDVSDSLLNLRDLPKKYWDDLKNRVSEMTRRSLRWNELQTEEERVRYLYRSALRRARKNGYSHHDSYTPKEALRSAAQNWRTLQDVEPELNEQYNAVRYGEKEPTPGVAEALRDKAGL